MNRELLFPTPVWEKQFPNSKELNKHLFKHIKAWSKKEPGVEKTNAGTGWHSETNMANKPEYEGLTQELFTMVKEIFTDYGLEMPFFMGNMWANINYPGAYNKIHLHPNSTLSGAYYVKVPKDSADCIFVEDPRPGPNIIMPRRTDSVKDIRSLWRVVKYKPTEGHCIMFPAWVPHGVEENRTKLKGDAGLRVSVSFNFVQGKAPSKENLKKHGGYVPDEF